MRGGGQLRTHFTGATTTHEHIGGRTRTFQTDGTTIPHGSETAFPIPTSCWPLASGSRYRSLIETSLSVCGGNQDTRVHGFGSRGGDHSSQMPTSDPPGAVSALAFAKPDLK